MSNDWTNKLRDQLADYQEPVSHDLWAEIEQSLAQSKKDYAASRNSADWGVGFGDVNITPAASDFGRPITSWGSAENPWLLKVATEQNVPDFAAPTPTATSAGSVSYLMLEAPLFNTATSFADLTAAEKSAYNLKMGLWTDVFVRDPTKIEGDADQFRLGQMYGGGISLSRKPLAFTGGA